MKKHCFFSILLFVGVLSLHAVDFYSVEVSTSPHTIYVGQIFQLNLTIAASQNVDLNPQVLNDLPPSFEILSGKRGTLSSRIGENQRQEFLHTFTFNVCSSSAFTREKLLSSCVVEVTTPINSFFGQSWQKITRSVPATWSPLSVLELPTQDCPPDYSGAIGTFSLSLQLEPSTLSVGDIATLSLTLMGTGNLANSKPSLPSLPKELFKSYSPEIAESGSLPQKQIVLDAKIVPLSTQAVEIASATFSYFDPESGSYKRAQSNPIHISFCEKESKNAPAVRTLELTKTTTTDDSDPTNAPSSYLQLYMAPSIRSLPTFKILPTASVTVLEKNGDGSWVRVRIDNTSRTGWMPSRN